MSDKINVEAILKKKLYEHTRPNFAPEKRADESCRTANWWYLQCDTDSYNGLVAAIKEIVEAVIDKCAENAKLGETEHGLETGWKFVDKESILNIKKEIEYE